MPGPTNMLLIEGTFSELAEEFAQYLDVQSKAEEGAGVQAEIGSQLNSIREAEQTEGEVDEAAIQTQKDEVLKKLVTKASILNTAPERGTYADRKKKDTPSRTEGGGIKKKGFLSR